MKVRMKNMLGNKNIQLNCNPDCLYPGPKTVQLLDRWEVTAIGEQVLGLGPDQGC